MVQLTAGLYTHHYQYNFRQEFPDLEMPTKNLIDTEGIAYTQNDGGHFTWEQTKIRYHRDGYYTYVTAQNEDFAYIRDVMGWPPDKRVKGVSQRDLPLGSGMAFDASTDSTQLGGWQGSIYHRRKLAHGVFILLSRILF